MDVEMATMKKGITVPAGQWWKHLKGWKRIFWKKQRKAHAREDKRNTEPFDPPNVHAPRWAQSLDQLGPHSFSAGGTTDWVQEWDLNYYRQQRDLSYGRCQ